MHQATSYSFQPGTPDSADASPDSPVSTGAADPTSTADPNAAKSGSLLSEHKGKLAVGAAAMLGIAIFYKWREHRLAKEDPEQYAQLKRIKSAVRENGSKSGPSD